MIPPDQQFQHQGADEQEGAGDDEEEVHPLCAEENINSRCRV